MISFMTGNIFESEAECLVNTVNCEGYMGKGIAYQFKTRFPKNNEAYVRECRGNRLRPGVIFAFEEDGKVILNFPTKDKWRAPSLMRYIEDGMKALVEYLDSASIHSIAIPPLGCGNGGLQWDDVRKVIIQHIEPLSTRVDFFVYGPSEGKREVVIKALPRLSPSALVVTRLGHGLLKPSKFRLQKAAFFMNYYMKSEYFKFKKAQYGPYDHGIDVISGKIGEYQTFHQLSPEETFDSIYQTICSKKTDSVLKATSEPTQKALLFVNSIEDISVLEGVSTTFFLIQEGCTGMDQIWQGFVDWPGNKEERFKKKDIECFLKTLEDNGMIERNIMGEYIVV